MLKRYPREFRRLVCDTPALRGSKKLLDPYEGEDVPGALFRRE
jgi:hypothetical protein